MKFSENWLRQYVATDASREQLAATLTAIGLEVEALTPLGDGLDGVVVARILECSPHPEADRLQVCRVDAGLDVPLQVVCGAPNARAGLCAPLAMIGAQVGPLLIKAARLRGVESNGMLCSAKELGLDDDATGLMELVADAPVGAPLADYLGLPDASIELKLTPNRADCFSVRGIAYDVAAACGGTVADAVATPMPALDDSSLAVELHAGADAPRYVGRVLSGVDAAASTPVWMAERLRRSGIRPLSLLVDVTQYVMLELGQPMHAFDRDLLQGPVGVRHARAGEALTLLDGREVVVDESFLVITDQGGMGAGRAVALAGVMGGHDTRVTGTTRNVFLEAAHFAPAAIIGRGRRLGLHTEAGHRFERGVDPELPRIAIEVATRLVVEIAGGTPGPVVEAVLEEHLPRPTSILLRRQRLMRVLGTAIADAEVERILRALGLEVTAVAAGWRVMAPARRFDLAIEEDLIEEVARIHGYDAIPTTLPGGAARLVAPSEGEVPEGDLRRHLAARDYLEAINYAFVDEALLRTWQAGDGAVPLANPLSAELGMMRTRLLPGLVNALARNAARQQLRVRLFECGKVFESREPGIGLRRQDAEANSGAGPQGRPQERPVNQESQTDNAKPKASAGAKAATKIMEVVETPRIAAVAIGDARAEQWSERARPVDFHDLKGDLESLASLSGAALAYRPSTAAWGHPGRSADIHCGDVRIGWLGELHPRLLAALDIGQRVVAFEIDLETLQRRRLARAQPLSKFPSVRRDLAFVVAQDVPWAAVSDSVRRAAGPVLRGLRLFDRYVGEGVESGCKSLAMGLILQDDSRTLTDRDVDAVVAEVIAALQGDHGARMRD
jgi:phenylalanyl-tRNA synthetase beta chain